MFDWDVLNQAIKLRDEGSIEGAIEIFNRLLEQAAIADEVASVKANLGTAFACLGKHDLALANFEAAMSLVEGVNEEAYAHFWYLRAYAFLAGGKPREALSELEELKRTCGFVLSRHDDLKVQVGSAEAMAMVHLRQFEKAIERLRILKLERLADQQEVSLYLAAALLATGQQNEALPLLFEAAAGPNDKLRDDARLRLSSITEHKC